jgi:acyl carrier protein
VEILILTLKIRIMELNEFIANFADQFDDTDASEIQANTEFHEIDEWGSLTGMGVIAMVKTVYGKTITGKEIRECVTVEDLFNLVASK